MMTNEEALFCVRSIRQVVENIDEWKRDYIYNEKKNEFFHKNELPTVHTIAKDWINSPL
jgi:hypothetical protein